MSSLIVRALKIIQTEKYEVFSFFLEAKDILQIADISRVQRDKEGKLVGLQRNEVKQHVNEITKYLDTDNVLFPNAITLAINEEIHFTKIRGPKIDSDRYSTAGTLEIPIMDNGFKPAWIVDGQQRALALSKCNKPKLPIPITAFVAKDLEVQREQFIRINKTKPLPKGLIDELLPTVTSILPADLSTRLIPSRITEVLNFEPKSPFYGLIKKTSTEDDERFSPIITHNSIIDILKTSIRNYTGCLYPYVDPDGHDTDYESMLSILYIYWGAVKKVFPEAWAIPPAQSRLMHGVGMHAMGGLMDLIMRNINPKDIKSEHRIVKELEKIKPFCHWTEGRWEEIDLEWNELQNISAHKRILARHIIKVYDDINRKSF
ncbi:DGQHR domain-containing protein [bacterium]|nr:DGQHR domain-containing protein [bacterium]MBU1990144.1 DGQHR domain-containing protein [bacterium]